MLCNGLPLGPEWRNELKAFWTMYRLVNPHHEAFASPQRLEWTLPFLYHGDEGRGRLRRAVLVCSYQPLLSSKGHSFKSRLLASVFPGERYACLEGEETLETLHTVIADDLRDLFYNGLEVQLPDGTSKQIYVAFCGVKGDWPWQSSCVAFQCITDSRTNHINHMDV
ncbi:unnamed protein product [Durusdinium trenchii]|uniref:Uncharacterized protein n=1 Tax=Durusdinium trenchii TaxID=1381693 RepID=A0ABP0RQB4_9DINO